MVTANGIDLSIFQMDLSVTWGAMFLNADKTIYGRYGTRDPRNRKYQISLAGFEKALEAVLELHRSYPSNKQALSEKRGPAPKFPVPEAYPSLAKYTQTALVNSLGRPEPTCVHCHYVDQAEARVFRSMRQPIPDDKLFPYPLPDVVGLAFDPLERATVKEVAPGSAASQSGFKPGDEFLTLEGQPLVSIADVQWVLHRAKDRAALKAEVRRDGKVSDVTLTLPAGWRRKAGVEGHASFIYRPISDAQDLSPAERKTRGLPEPAIAIQITWPGFGLLKEDVIVEVDGKRSGMNLNDFLAYTAQKKMPGDKIQAKVLRSGKEIAVPLTVP
jgi:membrane-associated protease RseP (regulator of RpoE activity)